MRETELFIKTFPAMLCVLLGLNRLSCTALGFGADSKTTRALQKKVVCGEKHAAKIRLFGRFQSKRHLSTTNFAVATGKPKISVGTPGKGEQKKKRVQDTRDLLA